MNKHPVAPTNFDWSSEYSSESAVLNDITSLTTAKPGWYCHNNDYLLIVSYNNGLKAYAYSFDPRPGMQQTLSLPVHS